MDIISFFRGIDGGLYYVVLAVNTILIFAIIGYLGEKNNQKLIKMSMDTPTPNVNKGLDFSTTVQEKHGNLEMPTVAATPKENIPISNNATMVTQMAVMNNSQAIYNANVMNQAIPNNLNNQQINNAVQNGVTNINNQPQMPINNTTNGPSINNEIDPNEKAPAVLVINSDNTNMPK